MNAFDYSEVKNLFKVYKNKPYNFSTLEHTDLIDEFDNNLNDLDEISKEITVLISQLIPYKDFAPNKNDIVTFGSFRIKLQRADPNTSIGLDNVTVPYKRGEKSLISADKALQGKLERLSREYYRVAFRMIKIVKKLPGLESFKCKSISIIRNQLIEHPEGKASGVTYDTFAYSLTEGPYIKGLRRGKQTQHMDKGFKTNSEKFISELKGVLENAIK